MTIYSGALPHRNHIGHYVSYNGYLIKWTIERGNDLLDKLMLVSNDVYMLKFYVMCCRPETQPC